MEILRTNTSPTRIKLSPPDALVVCWEMIGGCVKMAGTDGDVDETSDGYFTACNRIEEKIINSIWIEKKWKKTNNFTIF